MYLFYGSANKIVYIFPFEDPFARMLSCPLAFVRVTPTPTDCVFNVRISHV